MAQIKKGGSHGLWKVAAQLVGANGISYGIAGDSLASGSGSTPRILHYPKDAGIPQPDRTTIDFTGGDRWITSYQYGIQSLGSFDFTLQDTDADFIAMCTGTNVDQATNDEWTEYTEDHLAAGRPQLSLMFVFRIQSFENSTFGQTYYMHQIIPRCWVSPRGLSPSFQSPLSYAFQVTPASGSKAINGQPFGSNLNATDNTLAMYTLIADNPLAMATFVASGATASIVGAFQPISTVVGTATSTKNLVHRFRPADQSVEAGVADTITKATGTFDVGTALTPQAADVLTVLYESDGYLAVA